MVHHLDDKMLPNCLQLEFVVDNKLLAETCDGTSFPVLPTFIDIYHALELIMCNSWVPRMSVLPLVTWRKRDFNTLADGLAKLAMDEKCDLQFMPRYLPELIVNKGSVLQWHSDGGARGTDRAAAACTLTLLCKEANGQFSRRLLYAQALYLGDSTNSMQAETSALRLALSTSLSLMNLLSINE